MKNRLKAILLAAGLTVGMLGSFVYAEDAAQAVSEAASEVAAEAESELKEAEEAISEAASELLEDAQAADAAVDGASDAGTSDGLYAMYYDAMKESIPTMLAQLSGQTVEELDQIIENSQSDADRKIAATWKSVRDELGNFVEVTDQNVIEEGNLVTIISDCVYDGVDDKTKVAVEYEYDFRNQTVDVSWDVQYTFGKLLQQAGLNTLMGLGIVFLVLLFLSFIISQLHWIPDLVEGKLKKAAPAAPAAPAPAPVAADTAEEEELSDDLELVAVIAAAIAASENTSTDSFVVRSIKKANRRNWQSA